jgi:hypothetical protein
MIQIIFIIFSIISVFEKSIVTSGESNFENQKLIQVGSTKEQLVSIMGTPLVISCDGRHSPKGCTVYEFEYKNNNLASGNIIFWISNNVVIKKTDGSE